MDTIRTLEPNALWNHFSDLNAVPRPSKKEERIIAFMLNFGKSLDLDTQVDAIGNVLIKKPGTAGFEKKQTIVMQSHLDMVHQKNDDTVFDFDNQGIEMEIVNGWLKAKGTTLGADNGIGVAAIMAILSSTNIPHPPIEAFFTIDEETGMTGAMGLQPNFLSGSILLNLDTEDDDEISIGCAGGIDITANAKYTEIDTNTDQKAFQITVSGLNGGHSGMDIHKGLGNANKILTRVLTFLDNSMDINLASFQGGNLRNAIPREANALITVADEQTFQATLKKISSDIKNEFAVQDPNLAIITTAKATPARVFQKADKQNFLRALSAAHNGVFAMNATITELVETSNNLARVTAKNGTLEIACLTRSFAESGKENLVNSIASVFELAGYTVTTSGNYPGWEPNPNTAICNLLATTYQKMFGQKPRVMACHAGLECGILGTHYPDMEMISFGPTIRGAHSPEEKVSIASTQKFWKFLLEILQNTP